MKKERQARMRTRRPFAPLAFLGLLLALALPVATASAYETHLPLPFSPITGAGSGVTIETAGGIAVDETSDNVFLAEPRGAGSSKVDIFGAEGGAPVGLLPPYQLTGLNSIDAKTFESSLPFSHVAVDNSADSPNKGTLYVTENGAANSTRKVKKFVRSALTEKYEPAGELKAINDVEKGIKPFESVAGIAVDPNGNVFVADAGSNNRAIIKFSPTGTQLARFSTANLEVANPGGGSNKYNPFSVAIDSAGDLFVLVQREGNPGNPFTQVVKYPADEFGEIDTNVHDVFFKGPNGNERADDAYAIAVDATTDALYVARRSGVLQYDANTLAEEGEFGFGAFETGIRIADLAVNGATGHIYVSENGPSHGGPRKIDVFGPGVKLPTVTPKSPTKVIGPRATLNATVNPEDVAITACKFEYGTTSSYGTSVPCDGAIATDGSDHPVSADLTGLTPGGEEYHWRIVATNDNGTNTSPEQTFLSGPPVVTEAATDIAGAKAILHGTVLPQNLAVAECKFEYLSKAAFESNEGETDNGYSGSKVPLSKPCLESVPTDNGEHAVSAAIDKLLANGAIYHFRVATDGEAGPLKGNDEILVTANTFITDSASVVGSSVTLNGTVNLEGVALTGCEFEYGPTKLYGSATPCIPPFASIPTDSSTHAVTGTPTGLSANSSYHFRLVAENAEGKIIANDMTFTTTGAPLIPEQSASPLGIDKAILSGQINPVGFDASYHFEWGLNASYGQRTPAELDPPIGAGVVPVAVSQELSGLEEDTTYHYRIVAESSAGSSEGPDQTFTTSRSMESCPNAAIRAEQTSGVDPGGTAYLPSCMALEMASPPKKFNQRIDSPNFSASGDALQFISLAALAETPQLGSQNDPYVTIRTALGWDTHAVQPPLAISQGDAPPCSYDLELARWHLLARPGLGAANLGIVAPMSGGLDGDFSPLGPTVSPLNTTFDYAGCEASPGSSADGSAFFFRAEGASYLPDDPTTTAKGTASSSNTYEASLDDEGKPTLELLSRDAGGTVYGGSCGADVGWLGTGDRRAARGAISPDGSRVYFTTRPNQGAPPCKPAANKLRIMARTQTGSGPEISELISSECTRVTPTCATTDGDDNFMAASQEGSKVFFTTTRQLVDSDLDSGTTCQTAPATGCDLYLYDASQPTGSRLIQVSAGGAGDPTPGAGAGVIGLGDVAGDGSRAYFVATGLLTTSPNAQGGNAEPGEPNLYLYERNAAHPSGHTAFIATLATGEGNLFEGPGRNGMAAVPRLGSDSADLSVGGDGHLLFFSTKASLVPSDTDGKLDGYRYDAEGGSLERITKAAAGGSDNGLFDADGLFSSGEGRAPQDISFRRTVSEDGNTAVFMTAEGLDPSDQDGKRNVYIWRGGQVTAVAGSLADKRGETFTVSMSGRSVAFVTDAQLLSADGDGAKDIYVARAEGGFPLPPPLPTCHGEECQGPFPPARPATPDAPSATLADPGNLPVATPKCKKGFVRRQGRCVKRPGHKKGAHKKPQRRHAKASGRAGK